MATARFEQSTYTFNRIINGVSTPKTVYLKYILCNDKDVVLRSIDPLQGINQLNYYGINGTFYGGNYLAAISIYDGASIRDYGHQNGGATPKEMSTYVTFKNKVGNMRGFVDRIDVYEGHVYNGYTMSTSDVLWAVGGMSMLLDQDTLTETEYYTILNTEVESSVRVSGYAPRTAIVYLGGSTTGLNLALLTVHDSDGISTGYSGYTDTYVTGNAEGQGITMWELRNIIKGHFGDVSLAIGLDGGGSTCIRAKNGSSDVVYSTIIDPSYRTRMMRSLITVDM